jgi:hypothetical protein
LPSCGTVFHHLVLFAWFSQFFLLLLLSSHCLSIVKNTSRNLQWSSTPLSVTVKCTRWQSLRVFNSVLKCFEFFPLLNNNTNVKVHVIILNPQKHVAYYVLEIIEYFNSFVRWSFSTPQNQCCQIVYTNIYSINIFLWSKPAKWFV